MWSNTNTNICYSNNIRILFEYQIIRSPLKLKCKNCFSAKKGCDDGDVRTPAKVQRYDDGDDRKVCLQKCTSKKGEINRHRLFSKRFDCPPCTTKLVYFNLKFTSNRIDWNCRYVISNIFSIPKATWLVLLESLGF